MAPDDDEIAVSTGWSSRAKPTGIAIYSSAEASRKTIRRPTQ